jgi:VanZ family protein
MKINIYIRIVAAILAIVWMTRIFSYSSDDATASMQVSRSVSYDIVESANRMFGLGWDEDKILGISKAIEKAVRKLAHMGEYGVLGLLVCIACDAWRPSFSRAGLSMLICLVYACSDEFHQTFVDGRSGEVKDVCIDLCGALLALFLGWLAIRIYKKRVNRDGI